MLIAFHSYFEQFLRRSYLEQFLLFAPQGGVDVLDVLVGDLLEFLLGALEFVGGDLAVLLGRLEQLAGVAPDAAQGDAPSSAMVLATFTYSRRRSSVSCGNDKRIEMPSLLGDTPRSLSRMAFSMASSEPRSWGLISSCRASGTEIDDICCSGTGEP